MADEHRVDRLWPDPASDLSLDEAFRRLDLPDRPLGRPLVGVNMITSIDGRAQLGGNAEGLGSRADRRLMRLYRSAYDAVASGAGTLRADDFYSWLPDDLAEQRVAAGQPAQPFALLIAGTGAIPTDRRFFTHAEQPRAVAVGADSPYANEPLSGVETWVAPDPVPQPGWLL
ncbi:MAG TPA: dihydrofolate reductase family protein, partial [Candidatus Limnocylindria bacterium]|nr:dihydrofolate reductase family protein [Candidatus Limnocylindria bacterium]